MQTCLTLGSCSWTLSRRVRLGWPVNGWNDGVRGEAPGGRRTWGSWLPFQAFYPGPQQQCSHKWPAERFREVCPWGCWPHRVRTAAYVGGTRNPIRPVSYPLSPLQNKRLTLWEEVQEHCCSWSPGGTPFLRGYTHSSHYPGGGTGIGFLSRIVVEWGEEAGTMRPREIGRGSTGTCVETEPAWFAVQRKA